MPTMQTVVTATREEIEKFLDNLFGGDWFVEFQKTTYDGSCYDPQCGCGGPGKTGYRDTLVGRSITQHDDTYPREPLIYKSSQEFQDVPGSIYADEYAVDRISLEPYHLDELFGGPYDFDGWEVIGVRKTPVRIHSK